MKNTPHTEITKKAFTRRQMLRGGAMGIGSLVLAAATKARTFESLQKTMDTLPNNLKTSLHQEIEIHSTPEKVYAALLSSKQFAAFSGAAADISSKAGGAFSMFEGQITGRNVELVANQRIVQAWRPGSWKPGIYSIVKFELKASGDKTIVLLDHTGFPEGDFESLGGGWTGHYWEPLKKYFS